MAIKIENTIIIFGLGRGCYYADYDLIFNRWDRWDNDLWKQGILEMKGIQLFDKRGGDKSVKKIYKTSPKTVENIRQRYLELFEKLQNKPIKSIYPSMI